jgi:hypothetical protein
MNSTAILEKIAKNRTENRYTENRLLPNLFDSDELITNFGRDGGIRTRDLLLPKQTR